MQTNNEECEALLTRISAIAKAAARPWETRQDTEVPEDTKILIETLESCGMRD